MRPATEIHDELHIAKQGTRQTRAGFRATHGREMDVDAESDPYRDHEEACAATVDDIRRTASAIVVSAIAQSIQINIPGTWKMSREYSGGGRRNIPLDMFRRPDGLH